MFKKRKKSQHKAPVIVHEDARQEILKFVNQYQFTSDAARDLGCSFTHVYMMLNGFSWPSVKMAMKMEAVSYGYVCATKMMRRNYLK